MSWQSVSPGRASPPLLGSLRSEASKLAKAHRQLRKSPSAPSFTPPPRTPQVTESPVTKTQVQKDEEIAPEWTSFHTEAIPPGISQEVDDLKQETINLVRKHRFVCGRSPSAGSMPGKTRFDLLWCAGSEGILSPSRVSPLGHSPSGSPLRGLALNLDDEEALRARRASSELEILNALLSRSRDQGQECQELWHQLAEERQHSQELRESLADTLRMSDELRDEFVAQTQFFAKFVKDVRNVSQGVLKNGLGQGPLIGLLSEMDKIYTVRNTLSSKLWRLQRAVQRRSTKRRTLGLGRVRRPSPPVVDDDEGRHRAPAVSFDDAEPVDSELPTPDHGPDVSEENWDAVITSLEGKLREQSIRRREAEEEIQRLEGLLEEGRIREEEQRKESLRLQKESQEQLMDKDEVIRQLRMELQETQGVLQKTRGALERRRNGHRLGALPEPPHVTTIGKFQTQRMKQFLEPFKLLRKGTTLMLLKSHVWKPTFVKFNKKITSLQWSWFQALGSVQLSHIIGIGFGEELATPIWQRFDGPWRRFAVYTQSKAYYFQAPTEQMTESLVLCLSRMCPYIAPLRWSARSLRLERILMKVGRNPNARSAALRQAIEITTRRRTGTGEYMPGSRDSTGSSDSPALTSIGKDTSTRRDADKAQAASGSSDTGGEPVREGTSTPQSSQQHRPGKEQLGKQPASISGGAASRAGAKGSPRRSPRRSPKASPKGMGDPKDGSGQEPHGRPRPSPTTDPRKSPTGRRSPKGSPKDRSRQEPQSRPLPSPTTDASE